MLTEADYSALPYHLRFKVETAITSAQARISALEEKIRLLTILKYGPSSEKLNEAQRELLAEEPGVTTQEFTKETEQPEKEKQAAKKLVKRPSKRGAFTLSPDLPRVEEIIPCAPENCRCAICQEETKVIDYEVSERLDVVPARYQVKVIKREKRACPKCEEGGVKTAPLPPQIVARGIGTNAMVVDVVASKYELHLPLYRQEMQIERDCGVHLTRQTMCGWVQEVGFLLGGVRRAMLEELLEGGYVQADETTIGVQTNEKQGENHRGYLWEYSCPGGTVIFDYRDGRGREGPGQILRDFKGVLQTDNYSAYGSLRLEGVTLAGCMAHVRRKFVDAAKVNTQDKRLGNILAKIGLLYEVEREARAGQLSCEQRQDLRNQRSVRLMQELKVEMIAMRQSVLPQSLNARACDYALGQWEKMEVYLSNGQIEIDNNWCENAIRPIAIGRKNWLHFGSKEAAPAIAAIMSVVESCRRLKISVREYLLDVLPRLANGKASEIDLLTPSSWLEIRNRAASAK